MAAMTFRVGDYRAVELVGSGSTAQVWVGVRCSNGVQVAIKEFPPEELPAARREAALAAAVDHPHVVTVLDVVGDDQRAALITEFAVGGDLSDLLSRRGRLTPAETLTVLLPLAAALATAHEREIVHGDLSAANVVFDGAGRPLLADLGAGRAAAESGRPVTATPCDAAPELARGGPPTPSTDIFSLGSLALACLTGRHAWPADDLHDVVIQAAAGQWPDPDDSAGPPGLIGAVRAMLEHDPERRPRAASLVMDLRSAGRPEPLDLGFDLPMVDESAGAVPIHRPDQSSPAETRRGRHERSRTRDDLGSARRRPPAAGEHPDRLDSERSVRARASTRVRPEVSLVSEQADPGRQGGRRGRRPRTSTRRPARGLPSGLVLLSGSAVRISVIAAAAVVVALLAAAAGLWWAGWDRSDPVAAASLGVETAAPTSVPQTVRHIPARPPVASAPPSTRATAPKGVPVAASATSTPVRALPPGPAGVTPGAVIDWTATVRTLDDARAKALVARDTHLLDAVYTRDATGRSADVKVIESLLAGGLRVSGAGHVVRGAHASGGSPTTVVVDDSLPSYSVLDAGGTIIGATAARGLAARVLVLVRTSAGYRISEVRST